MKKVPSHLTRGIVAGLALLGLSSVVPVSLAELQVGSACPQLGPLPACHLVSLAYAAVLLSVVHGKLWNPWLFVLAWMPIFALAVTGSGLELWGQNTCPKTDSGIPKCYFSLGLAVALIIPVTLHFAKVRQQRKSGS